MIGLARTITVWLQRRIMGLSRHWLAWANGLLGVLSGLPWLAPLLIKVGATGSARAIYALYSFLCHQLANRSFFLFGPQWTYAYTDLLPFLPAGSTRLGLRLFSGTAELGYKVAWSDRMVSMYGGILLGGLAFALLRRRMRPLKWWGFVLLALPIAVDGVTHTISDLAGVGQGFRYHNAWLATLTGNVLPQSFYSGTTLGTFNSSMRLLTGLLFGLAVAWVVFPLLEISFRDVRRTLEARHGAGPHALAHRARETQGSTDLARQKEAAQ